MLQVRFTVLLILLVSPVGVLAANPAARPGSMPIYLSVFAERQSIGVAGSELKLPLVSGAIGWWVWPGIGLEVEAGKSAADDNINNLALEVHSQTSLSLRLESPPTDKVAAYMLFGVARTNLDSTFTDAIDASKKSVFSGARAALGITLQTTKQLLVDAAFTHHAYEDEIRINSFRLGLRYDF